MDQETLYSQCVSLAQELRALLAEIDTIRTKKIKTNKRLISLKKRLLYTCQKCGYQVEREHANVQYRYEPAKTEPHLDLEKESHKYIRMDCIRCGYPNPILPDKNLEFRDW